MARSIERWVQRGKAAAFFSWAAALVTIIVAGLSLLKVGVGLANLLLLSVGIAHLAANRWSRVLALRLSGVEACLLALLSAAVFFPNPEARTWVDLALEWRVALFIFTSGMLLAIAKICLDTGNRIAKSRRSSEPVSADHQESTESGFSVKSKPQTRHE